ncbi:hypothetical protein PIROE2DRAFT_2206 [Piromyces sp. E2]|nr:hypothetical protein PIROE2DRAFT_2206 [Piromyces sp. E2]|eukprot:OUM69782.1 hypothetical protein PIROE2DRAFT_2206 [Piromyces sp. E2]
MVATTTRCGKAFLLTLNLASLEYYADIKKYLTGLGGCAFFLCTEHIDQENKHYHIYVQYEHSKRLSLRKLYGSHIEKCFGSAQRNIAYCKAGDEKHQSLGITTELIDEEGEPRLNGGHWSVSALREMDNPDELPADSLRPINVIYFIGKPGCGKTYNAYKYALAHFQKDEITKVTIQNNFFEFVGSNKDKCLVIEEFRPSQLHPSSLLQFTDKYGGYKYVKPECIIICSIIDPRRLYREEKEELNE